MKNFVVGTHIDLYPIENNKINLYNRNTQKTYIIGEKEAKVISCLNGEYSVASLQEKCPFYSIEEIEKLLQLFDDIGVFKEKKKFNVFKIRFRLFNPNKIIKSESKVTSFLYYFTIIGCPIIFLFGLIFNLLNQTVFLKNPINVEEIISTYLAFNFLEWLVIFICSIISLFLHELSHIFSARFYKVNVPEFGLMLYCFLPVAYTNVSCINLLKSYKQKMVVISSGVLSNLAQIGLCYFFVNICSPYLAAYFFGIIAVNIGTILVNCFIFLKFDGYYLLEIMLNEPNLKEKASMFMKSCIFALFTKKNSPYKKIYLEQINFDKNFLQNLMYIIFAILSSVFVPAFIINSLISFFSL